MHPASVTPNYLQQTGRHEQLYQDLTFLKTPNTDLGYWPEKALKRLGIDNNAVNDLGFHHNDHPLGAVMAEHRRRSMAQAQ